MKNYYFKIISAFILLISFTNIYSQSYSRLDCYWVDLKFPLKIASTMFYDSDNDLIYVIANSSLYSLNQSRNIWTLINTDSSANLSANVNIQVLFMNKKGVMYAGSDVNTQSFVSYDRGRRWKIITYPLIDVHSIYEYNDGTVYFASSYGLYKTTDSAKTITKLTTPFTYVNYVTSDTKGNLWVGTTGLYKSTDNGSTWVRQSLRFPGDNTNGIAFTKSGTMYVSSNNDFTISTDGGNTWTSIVNMFTTNVVFNTTNVKCDKNDYIYFIHYGVYNYSEDGLNWYWCYCMDSSKKYISFATKDIIFDVRGDLYAVNSSPYNSFAVGKTHLIITGIDDRQLSIPMVYSLKQNYPNPFNPSTTIEFTIPQRGYYNISIYNMLGQLVQKLNENEYMPGNYKLDFDAGKLASGMYIYRLTGNNISINKKMMLLK